MKVGKIKIFEVMALVFTLGLAIHNKSVYEAIMGVCGLLYVFNVRRRHPIAFIYGLVFATMYSKVMWELKILAEFGFNVFITVPLLLLGIYKWHNNENSEHEVKLLDFKGKSTKLYLLIPIIYIATYISLIYFGGQNVVVDCLSTTFAMFATILTVWRYNNSFTYWNIANLLNISLHMYRGNYILVCVFMVYFINSLIGAYCWRGSK